MDENLTEGGEGARGSRQGLVRTASSSSIPQIKRWIRTPKAIIMHLTNGTIQVKLFLNFPSAHIPPLEAYPLYLAVALWVIMVLWLDINRAHCNNSINVIHHQILLLDRPKLGHILNPYPAIPLNCSLILSPLIQLLCR